MGLHRLHPSLKNHLVYSLLEDGHSVTILDNLHSGAEANLSYLTQQHQFVFLNHDITQSVGELTLEHKPEGIWLKARAYKDTMEEKEFNRLRRGLYSFSIGFKAVSGEYIEVQGLIREPQAGFMLQESNLDPNWPKLMQQIEIPLLNQRLESELFPFVLYAENQIGQLIPVPIKMENKYYMHVGYAIQWLLIGLAGIICFIVISRKEYKENERKEKKLAS